MLFPENIGKKLSIDEVSLSTGELYTFVTNKKGGGYTTNYDRKKLSYILIKNIIDLGIFF